MEIESVSKMKYLMVILIAIFFWKSESNRNYNEEASTSAEVEDEYFHLDDTQRHDGYADDVVNLIIAENNLGDDLQDIAENKFKELFSNISYFKKVLMFIIYGPARSRLWQHHCIISGTRYTLG